MTECFDNESPLGVYDMVGRNAIPQGADWDVPLRYLENNTPVDLSTYTARMQVREDYDKPIILELSTTSGTIIVGDGSGGTANVTLKFKSGTTSALSKYSGIYDLELLSPSGLVLKFIEGKFSLRREVTK